MISAQERCAAVLSTMAQGVVFHDSAGRIESCNEAAERIFGLTSDHMVGRTWTELCCATVHEDGAPFSSDKHSVMETLRTGKALSNIVLGVSKPNGTLTWISVDTRPLVHAQGKLCGVLAIFRDISGQKLADAALQDSEERFLGIGEGAVEGIYRTSPEGKILAANTVMAEILGYNSSEEIVNAITDVSQQIWLDPKERSALVGILEEHGSVKNYECQFKRKDGTPIWVAVNSRRVCGRDRNTVWYEGFLQDVTERKLTENKLRENEVRLRLALEATSDGVWERHIPSGNMFFSPRYYATLGYTPNEFEATYRSWETYVHAEDLPRVKAVLAEHFTQQKEYNVEFRLRHKSGEWRWIRSRGRVVEWDAQGRPIRMVGTYSDISARKLSEQRLQESERRLRALYDGAPVGIGVGDSNTGRFVQVNPAYCRITGRTRDELCGMDFPTRTHPEDVVPQLEYLRRLRAGEIPGFQMDKRYVRPDGSIVWASLTVVPLWESGATPTFHLSMVEEITARKQAEDALRNARAFLLALLESTDEPIWAVDLNFGLITYNAALRNHFAHRHNLILAPGMTPKDLLLSQDKIEELEQAYRRCLREGSYRAEYRGHGTLGLGFHQILQDGKVTGVAVFGKDITESKRAEAEREQLQAEFLQAQKMESIGRLAGGVAHDFNNLLTVINGYSDLLIKRLHREDPLLNSLLEIRKAGEKAAELTRQLLTFSRKQVVEPRPVNLDRLIQESHEMLSRILGEDVEIVAELASEAGLVMADPGQLNQVLMNLVVNARDAMPEGGRLVLRTSRLLDENSPVLPPTANPGPYVLLEVSDSGVGMDEGIQQRVFEPFFSTKGSAGTGLGLSTVYGIVQQAGGWIKVESQPRMGTTFRIGLPSWAKPGMQDLAEDLGPEQLEGSETILVVEDQDAVRRLAVAALQAFGYQTLEASSADDALQIVATHAGTIHLVLTDVVMPGMDGRQLANRLRRLCPEVKVLYMSGHAAEVISGRGLLDPGVEYIQKPFTPDALAQKVRKVLGEI